MLDWYPLIASYEALNCSLSNGVGIDDLDDNGATALTTALSAKRFDVAVSLIAAGADVNRPNEYGGTALYIVAEQGELDFVQALAEKGADLKAVNDFDGCTPLMIACAEGRLVLPRFHGGKVKRQSASVVVDIVARTLQG